MSWQEKYPPTQAPGLTQVKHRSFDAFKIPGFTPYVLTFMLTMMADNVEHVITYWMAFQKFHSTALGGFAVISHWVPYLLFSVSVGALNDRFNSRRLIQLGGVLFMICSLSWGYLLVTDTLTMPIAMALLCLHGLSGVFWMISSQVLLYDIVGPEHLPSAVRLSATARYLGLLGGPGLGSLIMYLLGPQRGIFLNAALYLPLISWLAFATYGRREKPATRKGVQGLKDIIETIAVVKTIPQLAIMILLSGAGAFFIGTSYSAQMPAFATDLGNIEPGIAYSMLLGADAAGALIAGLLAEAGLRASRISPTTAMGFALGWATALGCFALTHNYVAALCFLFVAGFFDLSANTMTQTIVQMQAPNEIRGKVLGLFGMASAGLRLFSGVFVGLIGVRIGIHFSLAATTILFGLTVIYLLRKYLNTLSAAQLSEAKVVD